jgi:hypothetical protein
MKIIIPYFIGFGVSLLIMFVTNAILSLFWPEKLSGFNIVIALNSSFWGFIVGLTVSYYLSSVLQKSQATEEVSNVT